MCFYFRISYKQFRQLRKENISVVKNVGKFVIFVET